MIVIRFSIHCQSGKADQVREVLEDVVHASRDVDGVVHFDIGSDITDPDRFVATEVFEDRAALDRQEELPEVVKALGVLEHALASPPVATIFHVSSSEPWEE